MTQHDLTDNPAWKIINKISYLATALEDELKNAQQGKYQKMSDVLLHNYVQQCHELAQLFTAMNCPAREIIPQRIELALRSIQQHAQPTQMFQYLLALLASVQHNVQAMEQGRALNIAVLVNALNQLEIALHLDLSQEYQFYLQALPTLDECNQYLKNHQNQTVIDYIDIDWQRLHADIQHWLGQYFQQWQYDECLPYVPALSPSQQEQWQNIAQQAWQGSKHELEQCYWQSMMLWAKCGRVQHNDAWTAHRVRVLIAMENHVLSKIHGEPSSISEREIVEILCIVWQLQDDILHNAQLFEQKMYPKMVEYLQGYRSFSIWQSQADFAIRVQQLQATLTHSQQQLEQAWQHHQHDEQAWQNYMMCWRYLYPMWQVDVQQQLHHIRHVAFEQKIAAMAQFEMTYLHIPQARLQWQQVRNSSVYMN
ncbi:MAG: hypothetical protein Q4D05_05965 [Acinetobacter sp.]|nr:hypothetical protein [Acinetobacter sp.]